jgi:hypothetical protein
MYLVPPISLLELFDGCHPRVLRFSVFTAPQKMCYFSSERHVFCNASAGVPRVLQHVWPSAARVTTSAWGVQPEAVGRWSHSTNSFRFPVTAFYTAIEHRYVANRDAERRP